MRLGLGYSNMRKFAEFINVSKTTAYEYEKDNDVRPDGLVLLRLMAEYGWDKASFSLKPVLKRLNGKKTK
nr:hypothetical protein [Marinibactrum halimedae]